jgi:hypothetical protein
MRKLITGAIVAAALAVPATPAFAIHDPNVPAGTDVGTAEMPSKGCSATGAQAVGDRSRRTDHGNQMKPNTDFSNSILVQHNNANPPCHNDPN